MPLFAITASEGILDVPPLERPTPLETSSINPVSPASNGFAQ